MEDLEIKRKRLKMRSMRRGIKEMDLILKNFADLNLNLMSELELENFENLLLENDQDLYQWSTGQVDPKKEFVDLIENIKQIYNSLLKSRPPSVKGQFLEKISISSSMGPGVKVNINSIG